MFKEEREIEHDWEFRYKLKPGDIFVEGGSFIGRYGKRASRIVGPSGKVILIEPSPRNLRTLCKDKKIGKLGQNVTIIDKAIGDHKGYGEFLLDGNSAGDRFPYLIGDKEYPTKGMIKIDTLDNILTELGIESVDLLGADIENSEVPLIRGASKYLREYRIKNVAIAAYHHRANPEFIMILLKYWGYKNVEYVDGVVYANV